MKHIQDIFQKHGKKLHFKAKSEIIASGDTLKNIYFLAWGTISVNQLDSSWKSHKLGTIEKWHIFWESSLIWKNKLTSTFLIAQNTVEVLCIEDAQKVFQEIFEEKEKYDIFLSFIEAGYEKISLWNTLLTATLELNQALSSLKSINSKSINTLLEKFQKILQSGQIVFLEKIPGIENYFKIKYNSCKEKKYQNSFIEFDPDLTFERFFQETQIQNFEYILSQALKLWEDIYWYLIFSRDTKYSNNEILLINSIASSFVGIIRQNEIQNEEKNKQYLKSHENFIK